MATATIEPEVKQLFEDLESEDITNELYDFGKVLMQEVLSRSAVLDSKLSNFLGWAAGVVSLVLIGQRAWLTAGVGVWERASLYIVLIALIAGAAGALLASLGLRTREWPIPKYSTWLRRDLFDRPSSHLKKFHTLALYGAIKEHNIINQTKGWYAHSAEIMLVLGSILVAAAAVIRIVLALYDPGLGD